MHGRCPGGESREARSSRCCPAPPGTAGRLRACRAPPRAPGVSPGRLPPPLRLLTSSQTAVAVPGPSSPFLRPGGLCRPSSGLARGREGAVPRKSVNERPKSTAGLSVTLHGVRRPRQSLPAGMKCLVALALGFLALAAASQSPLQRRVVKEVLDYFHGRSNVHHYFKEQSVEGAVEREDPSGTFVQLRVNLAQTACRKRDARRQNCKVVEGKRKPACVACFKFDSGDVPKVLDKYYNCGPSHHLAVKEIKHRDEAECREVEEAGKSTDSLYLPGMFAFSKGLPA
uniref:Retinoic acid receptor responder protein 2 n=2 Tax=Dromaius novaehollandiae TaxID=8790 RepID=A0A8C4IUY5_DRONO|nr:retinoic acid receptor responder protein 2 [Dromaius novaehollandiae]